MMQHVICRSCDQSANTHHTKCNFVLFISVIMLDCSYKMFYGYWFPYVYLTFTYVICDANQISFSNEMVSI